MIHLAHFLMFNLLMDAVEKHGRATKTKPRMVIVGSITHNPTELAGKIPPQANLGDCRGLFKGFQAEDGVVMIDGGRFDGPKVCVRGARQGGDFLPVNPIPNDPRGSSGSSG